MLSLLRNRSVWLGLLIGLLGGLRLWTMAISGVAQLPHIAAALTLLIPLIVLGVLIQRVWPAALGVVIVVVIELSLS